MITQAHVANFIWALASLFVLWLLLAKGYRAYRIDFFRQRLFAMRDELFDIARSGQIGFDDPSYSMLRQTLNGFIRYAETLRFGSLAIHMIQLRPTERQLEAQGSFLYRWEKLRAQRPVEVDKKLQDLVMKMHLAVVGQIIMTSPFLLLMIVPLLLYIAAHYTAHKTVRPLYEYCRRYMKTPIFDVLDSHAFEIGTA